MTDSPLPLPNALHRSVYDHVVDPEAANNSHAMMLRMVGKNCRVLEFGCASGGMTRALRAQGCTVMGVEIDASAAEAARAFAEAVHVCDLDRERISERLAGERFDVILFGDVLEHLRDPQQSLTDAVQLLADDGRVVISVPNMAHGDVRLALLEGQVPYADLGLLDRTHRHWFTRDNLQALLKACGLSVMDWQRTVKKITETEVPYNRAAVPKGLLRWLGQQPEATTYQFVVTAGRGSWPEGAKPTDASVRWSALRWLTLPFV